MTKNPRVRFSYYWGGCVKPIYFKAKKLDIKNVNVNYVMYN